MKILFLSDIHGIYNNLEYIKELENKEDFDKIILLGDLYYTGPSYNLDFVISSKKVLEFFNLCKKIVAVKGNCDADVDIKASNFPISEDLTLFIDDLNIYCSHGNKVNRYKHDKINKNTILIYGHEHIPYIVKEDDLTFINVGSISLTRCDNEPTYGIYKDKTFTIYDIHNNIVDYIEF